MGEISDDITEGRCCYLCGGYFDNPVNPNCLYEHGYPVACWNCWKHTPKSERKDMQKALVPTL